MSFVPTAKGKGSWKYAGTQYELSMIKYVITIVLNKIVLLAYSSAWSLQLFSWLCFNCLQKPPRRDFFYTLSSLKPGTEICKH